MTEKIRESLKAKGLVWEEVDLQAAIVFGIDNIVCFKAMEGGFIVTINPKEIKVLSQRPKTGMVTDNLVPTNDALFIIVDDLNDEATIDFWIQKGLEYFKQKKAIQQTNVSG